MRYLFGFSCALALGIVLTTGCGETSGGGGEGGSAGEGGTGGTAGNGTGGVGGMGPADPCEDVECNYGGACTTHTCEADCTDGDGDGNDDTCLPVCVFRDWPKDFPCDCAGFRCNACDGAGSCVDDGAGGTGGSGGDTSGVFQCTAQGIRDAIVQGGGPHTFDCNGPTTITTDAEIVINNHVILDGEGNLTVDGNQDHRVFLMRDVTAELRGFTVSGGAVIGEAGAGIANAGSLTLVDSTFSANVAEAEEVCGDFGCFLVGGDGAAISNEGHLVAVNSTVSGNTGTFVGGIGSGRGTLTVTDSTVSNNEGGGIQAGLWITVTNSTVSQNVGLGLSAEGILQLASSTVSGNAAGGIVNRVGPLIVTDSTISGNSNDNEGGGIRIEGDSDVETEAFVVNSTVSGNSASQGSGIACFDASLVISHSTVSDSVYVASGDASASVTTEASVVDGACTQEGDAVTWTSSGYNIESPGNTCGFDQATDLVLTSEELDLGLLQDNGGPTETHALQSGSEAIDWIPEGDCELETDQRGEPRPEAQGMMCDVGAFERQPSDP